MTFLQPFVLFGIPLIAVPIIIHLLNRMRYRSRAWAAMSFLLAASRRSRRHARLRHWLILLCRALGVLALILGLARPLAGGWLGWALHGAPDTVVLLLDRSPSMETRQPDRAETKRELALARLTEAASEMSGVGQVILIDSASLVAQEIGGVDALPVLKATSATDTAADIPQLMAAAIEALIANRAGRAEIWLVSDLQSADWHPDSPRWTDLTAQLAELPQDVQVRLMALPAAAEENVAIRIHDLKPVTVDGSTRLDLVIDVERSHATGDGSLQPVSFPLSVVLGGARRPLPIRLDTQSLRLHHQVDLGDRAGGGWGYVELPADTNLRDNRAYFVYNPRQHRRALVMSGDAEIGRLLQLAAAPSPSLVNLDARVVSGGEFAGEDLADVALVLWQGEPPTGADVEVLEPFLEHGGVVLAFPPRHPDSGTGLRHGSRGLSPSKDLERATGGRESSRAESSSSQVRVEPVPFWSEPEPAADPDQPYRVSVWEDRDGLLADTSDGTQLLVNEIRTLVRCTPRGDWSAVGSYSDGTLFLGRRTIGRGRVYACATLPVDEWSDLGNGMVLVPMIQRALRDGAVRLGLALNRECGDATAMAGAIDDWRRVDADEGGRWVAGIYQAGPRWLALNRSAAEDTPEKLDEAAVRALFGPVPLRFFDEAATDNGRLQSEMWRVFVAGVLLLLVAEALLALPGAPREVTVS